MLIISALLCVVNYNADGSKSTLLDKLKTDHRDTIHLNDFSKEFKQLDDFSNLDELIKRYPLLSDKIKNTAQEVAGGTKSMKDFDIVMQESSTATSVFGSTLKTIGANLAIMFLINFAVKALSYTLDKLIETQAEASEAAENAKNKYEELESGIDNLNQELQTTQNRLKELDAIGYNNLTLVEREEYDRLKLTNDELERELRIQKALAGVAAQEAGDAANNALTKKSQTSMYMMSDPASGKVRDNLSDENYLAMQYAGFNPVNIDRIDYLNELIQKSKEQQKELERAKKARDNFFDTFDGTAEQAVSSKAYKALDKTYEKAQQTVKDTEKEIGDSYRAIEDDSKGLVDSFGNVVEGCEDTYERVKTATQNVDEYFAEVDSSSTKATNVFTSNIVKTSGAIKTMTEEIDNVISSYDSLNAAIAAQSTGNTVVLTKELKEYNSCLEYVNGTMQLNAEKARELANAKVEEKIATLESQDALEKTQYLKNSSDIERYTQLLGNKDSILVDGIKITDAYIQSLRDSNQQIISNCDNYALQASRLRETTGAYQEWLNAQNVSESGTMFTDAGNAIKAIQDGLKTGKTGTEVYTAALKFLLPESIDGKDQESVKNYLNTLERYFADNGSGVNNFIADALSEGLIETTEDGLGKVVDGVTVQDFVDKLKITPEAAQAIFGELEEYDWEFDWGFTRGIDEALVDTKKTINDLQDEFDQRKSLKLDTSDTLTALKEAKKTYNELLEALTQKTDANINTEEFEKKLEEVEQKKEELYSLPDTGDFVTVRGELDSLNEELIKLSGLNEITVTAYIEDAEKDIENLKAQLGLVTEESEKVELRVELDEKQNNLEIVKTLKFEQDSSVAYTTSALEELQKFQIGDKAFTVSVASRSAMENLQKVKAYLDSINNAHITISGGSEVNGSANSGTAHANGNWGTQRTETALIGEVGREIVVDPYTSSWRTYGDNGAEFARIPKGSIIFNHKQTEELLARGFVNGYGSAYVRGTAYLSENYSGSKVSAYGSIIVPVSGDDSIATNNKLTNNAEKTAEAKESSAKSAKKETEEVKTQVKEFSWIQNALDYVEKKRERIANIADEEYVSYQDQLRALQDLLDLDQELITVNQLAYDDYLKQWKAIKTEILQAFGEIEGNSLIGSIMGDSSPEDWHSIFEYKDDDEVMASNVELLEKAQDVYGEMEDQEDNLIDTQREATETQQKIFETRINIIKTYQDEVTSAMDEIEAAMDMKETVGHVVVEDDYRQMIRLAEEQISLYENELDVLKEQADSLDYGSAEWYSVQSDIAGCQNEILQCEQKQAEWNEEIKRLPVERLQKYLNILQNVKEDLDNFLSERNALGIQPTIDQYKQQISLSQEQITALLKQQDILKGLLSDYQYGSEKYNDTADEIQDIDNEISSLIENQYEWNDAIRQIPLNQMQKYLDSLSNTRTDLDNLLSEQEANGRSTTIDQYKELNTITLQQLSALEKQKAMLSELLGEYDKDSERYAKVENQIQEIENEMSGLVQNQYEWNQAILQMPLDRLSEANDALSKYSNVLSDILSEYDSALSGINTLLSDQIDLINDQKEATEKDYQEKIDPLQEQLDLLNKQNEARQVQLNLEQAQYNLDKAKNQKSTQVIRNGEIQYEANIDDLRSANQEMANAQLEKVKYDLQTQIETLEEERDKLLETYDDEIERLNEIQERWSSIVEEIKKAGDAAKAEEVFGKDWRDKILSGNDADLIKLISGLYESTHNQKEQVEDQIASNERISEMMEQIVKQYQDGSLTYDEAISRIRALTSSMQDGYSALEQLNSLMNMDGIKDLADLADSSQKAVQEAMKQLSDYMGIVKSNSDSVDHYSSTWEEMKKSISGQLEALQSTAVSMEAFKEYLEIARANSVEIGKYTSTWEEVQKSIKEQVEALKKAAEELERFASRNHSSSGSSGSHYDRGESNSGDVTVYNPSKGSGNDMSGPGYIDDVLSGDKDAVDSWNSGNTGGADQDLTDYVNDHIEKRHNGIKDGLVGSRPSDKERESNLVKLTLEDLKPNEEHLIALKGEAVLTEEQQDTLFNNMVKLDIPQYNLPVSLTRKDANQILNFTMGDVTLPQVKDPDGFAKALKQQFRSAVRQEMSKWH